MEMSSTIFDFKNEGPVNTPDTETPHTVFVSENGHSILSKTVMNGNTVCIKSLKPEFIGNPIYEALLKKEYEIGSSISHPNICRTLDYLRIEPLGNCVVTEWIEGRTLSSLLQNEKVSPQLGRKIILELCDALDAMHHLQIVHRDIKPDNILITHNGDNVKIIDFGLSDTDSSATMKMAAGTEVYAAPEQIKGDTLNERSDIYALGKVISQIAEKLPGRKGLFYKTIAARCTEPDIKRRLGNALCLKQEILKKERRHRQIPIYICAIIVDISILISIFAPDLKNFYRQVQIKDIVYDLTEELLEIGTRIE